MYNPRAGTSGSWGFAPLCGELRAGRIWGEVVELVLVKGLGLGLRRFVPSEVFVSGEVVYVFEFELVGA